MKPVFHEGELAVQARAGVQEMASQVGKSIRSVIPLAAQEFMSVQPFAVISSIDPQGHIWASILSGHRGFMRALDDRTVKIQALPATGDPLAENILVNDQIGMIVIDFAARRRIRINGTAKIEKDAIRVHSEQVYSNCPKYIQARAWESKSESNAKTIHRSAEFSDEQQHRIERSDTFFIASHHKDGGADASHRGGNPGFIHVVDKKTLTFPDYTGNAMFQTLGNITVNPSCGFLFIDFERGSTLQLTGTARIIWDENELTEFAGAERAVEFQALQIIEVEGVLPLYWNLKSYSPHNPPIK
jgi:uncharacterized protein